MDTVEGRSRLIHEARPLLQKIAAPVMQLQLLKQLAEMSGMTQDEASRLCGIRIEARPDARPQSTPSPGSGAASTKRGQFTPRAPIERSVHRDKAILMAGRRRERDFLRWILTVPPLAEKVPEEVMALDTPESKTLAAVVAAVAANGVTNTAQLVELLRDGPHDAAVAEFYEEIMLNPMPESDVEVDFGHALVHVEEQRLNVRIEALLNKGRASQGGGGAILSPEEGSQLKQLLEEQRKLKDIRAARPPMI